MSFGFKKLLSPFTALNAAQFCSALNDNIYKLLLIFFLIHLKGQAHSNIILSLAGAIFVIPFLFFASTAGTLADRFSKKNIICITRFTEIFTVALGVVAFALQSEVFGYFVLFLMATQSALFSPSKYGIIPEIVIKQKVSHYNGILIATTYLAIIFGTFLGSFLTDITHKNFILAGFFCVFIAIVGFLLSLGLPKTLPQASDKKVSAHFISEIFKTLKHARNTRYLLPTIIFGAYFLFIGAYTQLNIIPFAIQSLHLSEIQGGYLFLMTAMGIGIGSFVAGRLSGKEVELGFVPLAAFGIAWISMGLFFLSTHWVFVVILLVFMGIMGGFYVVPIDAYIQVASPNEDRGQNVAAANFLSFTGVIIASFLLFLFGNILHLSAAEGFLVIGIFTGILSLLLLVVMADQVLRLFVSTVSKLLGSFSIKGKKNIELSLPTLLIGQRVAWIDTLIVMATLPRMVRYIVPLQGRFLKGRSLIYRSLRLIPLDKHYDSPLDEEVLIQIRKELENGHSVCLMLPVNHPTTTLKDWEKKLFHLIENLSVPMIPIHIQRSPLWKKQRVFSQLKTLLKAPIIVSYGKSQILDK